MVATTSWQKISHTTYVHPVEGGGEAYASRTPEGDGVNYSLSLDLNGRRIEAVWSTSEGGRVIKAPRNRADLETLSAKIPHSCMRYLPAGMENIFEGYLFKNLGIDRSKKK